MYSSKLESDIDLEKKEKKYNQSVMDKNDIFFIYTLEPRFYLIALINSVSFGLILIFCCFIAMALIIISPFWRFNLLINTCT